jgi:hypothetical protein
VTPFEIVQPRIINSATTRRFKTKTSRRVPQLVSSNPAQIVQTRPVAALQKNKASLVFNRRTESLSQRLTMSAKPTTALPVSGATRRNKTRSSALPVSKKQHSYRPLATKFRHGGFNFRQIVREGDVAIFEQTWSGCPDPSVCYEVVRIRRHDGFEIAGKRIEPAEFYPKSESWGVDGFTLTDRDRAFAKLRELMT